MTGGQPITIGDTYTSNQYSGERYFGYTKKEAEQAYRKKHGLQGMKFRKVTVDPTWFGYLDIKQQEPEIETAIVTITDTYTTKMGDADIKHIKFEPETAIKLEVCDEQNEAYFWVCTYKGPDVDKLIGHKVRMTVSRTMAWHLNVINITTL